MQNYKKNIVQDTLFKGVATEWSHIITEWLGACCLLNTEFEFSLFVSSFFSFLANFLCIW